MDSAPWIYELSFMWMLLVLSAYQSKHSHEQDLMEATQPQIGHKCPANPYTTSWDFPCSIFCPRPNKKNFMQDHTLRVATHLFFQSRAPFASDFPIWK